MSWQKKTGTSSLVPKTREASPLVSVSAGPSGLTVKSSSPSAFAASVQTPTSLDVRSAAATILSPKTPGLSGLGDKTPFWYALVIDEASDQVVAADGSYVIVGDTYLDLDAGASSGLVKKASGATTWQLLH